MRSRSTVRAFVLVLALALVAPTMVAAAGGALQEDQDQAEEEPRFRETEKKWVLGNDEITVWFQGKKPLMKVLSTQEGNTSYEFHALRVAEFVDEDGDGAYDENEAVSFMPLTEAANWNVSTESGEDWLRVNMTLTNDIRNRGPLPGGPSLVDREGTVSLVFHVFADETTLETATGDVVVAPGQVKFDFIVSDWAWANDDEGQIALVSNIPAGNDTRVNYENGTHVVEVVQNGTQDGEVLWQPTAQAFFGNETKVVEVIPSVKGEETENGSVQVAWAYNASGFDRLVHDPTMGVQGEEAEEPGGAEGEDAGPAGGIPGPGAVAAAAVLGLAALAVRRRRR